MPVAANRGHPPRRSVSKSSDAVSWDVAMTRIMCSFVRWWRADWLAVTRNIRHDALARTPVLALECTAPMPLKTILPQEPRAQRSGGNRLDERGSRLPLR
jgi:hypothetical protein